MTLDANTVASVEELIVELRGLTDRSVASTGELCAGVLSQLLALDAGSGDRDGHRGLDSDERVRFYEHEFYVLSNFSAFQLAWRQLTFPTVEHAYHWEKFNRHGCVALRRLIHEAPSAHEAFQIARLHAPDVRPEWPEIRVDVMRDLLRAKVRQHAYVRTKLLQTGDRELVEDSWRDGVWGWGSDRQGQNLLGKLWMEIRAELRQRDLEPTSEITP